MFVVVVSWLAEGMDSATLFQCYAADFSGLGCFHEFPWLVCGLTVRCEYVFSRRSWKHLTPLAGAPW